MEDKERSNLELSNLELFIPQSVSELPGGYLSHPKLHDPSALAQNGEGKDTIVAFCRWIIDKSRDPGRYGEGNFSFACLEGLLRLHMTALHIHQENLWFPVLNTLDGGKRDLLDALKRCREDSYACNRVLLVLGGFVSEIYNMEDTKFRAAYTGIRATYEREAKSLELAGAYVRDHMQEASSSIATEMAQLSVKESKRAMLCKSPSSK